MPVLSIVTGALRAEADCPTTIEELPPAGFIAAATRAITDPDAPREVPSLSARVGLAGSLRADPDDVAGAGSVSAQLAAHHRTGFAGCASADVAAGRDVSAHVTASGAVPFFFTAMSFGLVVDRDVELPLAARPEFFLARASKIAAQFGISFVDFGLAEQGTRLRVMVMPFSVEQALARQDIDAGTRERFSTAIDAAMFRFVATAHDGIGRLDVGRIVSEWVDLESPMPLATGFVRISPLSIDFKRTAWRYTLDGGALSLAGPIDCERLSCTRGFYRFALGRAWRDVAVEARAERSAFMAIDDTVALDDRLTATATLDGKPRSATLSAFGALTRPWLGGATGRTGGVRVVIAQRLRRGFLGTLDGELARSYYGARSDTLMVPAIDGGARVLLSLGWQASVSR